MRKKEDGRGCTLKDSFGKFSKTYYLPIEKGRRIAKIPRPFFLTSTASVSTETILEFEAIRKMQNNGDEFFQHWCWFSIIPCNVTYTITGVAFERNRNNFALIKS